LNGLTCARHNILVHRSECAGCVQSHANRQVEPLALVSPVVVDRPTDNVSRAENTKQHVLQLQHDLANRRVPSNCSLTCPALHCLSMIFALITAGLTIMARGCFDILMDRFKPTRQHQTHILWYILSCTAAEMLFLPCSNSNVTAVIAGKDV